MEKKLYEKPLIEVVSLEKEDIIVTSSFGNEHDENFDKWDLGPEDDLWSN